MNNDWEVFEIELKKVLTERTKNISSRLREAMFYAVFSGGKRIRPTLLFASARFFKVDIRDVLPLAVSIELIHSYSLVHDDLPCMDNDTYRRGQLTTHAKFGETTALLCGDALLNLAYEILFDTANNNASLLPACKMIAQNAGIDGMIGGQMMEFDGKDIDEERLYELDKKKTGALIYSSLMAPSFLSGEPKKISDISSFAQYAGLAFQISDDILDKDKAERVSFVSIKGEEYAKNKLILLQNLSERLLLPYQAEGEELKSLFQKLAFRNL